MNLALINLAAFSYENVLEPFYPPLKGNSLGDKSFGLSGCRWQHSTEHCGWLGHKHKTHTHTHIHVLHKHKYTHILQLGTRTFSWRGRHGDPRAEKPCDPTGTEDTLLDPSDQPRQENLPLSFPKREEGRGGKKTEFNYTVETHFLPSGSDISTI